MRRRNFAARKALANMQQGQKKSSLIANSVYNLLSRRGLGGGYNTTYEGERNVSQILGYRNTEEFTADLLVERYSRGDITAAVVDAPIDDTWKNPPPIAEYDGQIDTKFVNEWNLLVGKKQVWKRLRQLDTMASLGRFSILVLGLRDSDPEDVSLPNPLHKPVNIPSLMGGIDDLLYLQVYGENSVSRVVMNKDPNNANYMLPESYIVQAGVTSQLSNSGSVVQEIKTLEIHASRVIHVAERTLDSDVLGIPRLWTVWNRLDDLEKVIGGSSESFWRMVREKMITLLENGYNFDDSTARSDMQSNIDAMAHEITNALVLQGVKDFTIEKGQEVDPSGIFGVLISLISAATRIPQRILLGSERGELASSQDEGNWAGTIATRQNNYAEPTILRPFIDKLIEYKIISAPKDKNKSYRVGVLDSRTGIYSWPPIYETNDSEDATISSTRATALKMAQEVQASGFPITDNEVRNMGGLLPIEGGDELGQPVDEFDPEGADMSPVALAQLNGIQLRSVMDVLFQISKGQLAADLGADLISSSGIPLVTARIMAQKAAKGTSVDLLDAIDDVLPDEEANDQP